MQDITPARGLGTTISTLDNVRVGIDLVAIDEIGLSVELYGERYLRRIFTDGELEACQANGRTRVESLAARFAAKEAAVKVLQPSDGGPWWKDVEVCRLPNGACRIQLHGPAARLADEIGIRHFSVSMTHERDMAAAVVIAW